MNSSKAIEMSRRLDKDLPIAKNMDGKIVFTLKKEVLQKAIQESLKYFKQDFNVNEIKIATSNIKTHYLAIVGTYNNSKEAATLFLPINNTGNSPNYYFVSNPRGQH